MRSQKEKLRIKDAIISKIQFAKEWFYKLDNVTFYLKKDLSKVEFIFLPIIIKGKQEFVKRKTFDDSSRG